MQRVGFKDRRMFARFLVKMPLRYLNVASEREGEGQLHDIGANGTGLLTNQKLYPSVLLDIWLLVPDNGDPLYIRGEAVWVKRVAFHKYRVGIKLEKPELMRVSRVLNIVRLKQNIPAEKPQSTKTGLLLRCLQFLRISPL